MLNAAVGVQRAIARLRSDTGRPLRAADTIPGRSLSTTQGAPAGSTRRAASSGERLVRATAVGLVTLALAVSGVGVGVAAGGPTGNTDGAGSEPRIALGGAIADRDWKDAMVDGPADSQPAAEGNVGFESVEAPISGGLAPDERIGVDPFSDEGTLVELGLLNTDVADAPSIRTYRVRSGDTLSEIAKKFHVSTMTVWWANHLKSKDDLRIGQPLRIPPVNGLIVAVRAGDTLQGLAARYHAEAAEIVAINGLVNPNLVPASTLVIPGARGAPIATPKPAAPTKPKTSSGSPTSSRAPAQYTGGKFAWPVAGGDISQSFHYGHYAIDIAADSGTRVMAAAGGVVTFAGWKNNGGGYQVWIAHGSGLFTTYNHMSSISVGRGQHVGRGQGVGRVGMSGNASGPHLHFEVWRGPIWDGGTRVNPLIYL